MKLLNIKILVRNHRSQLAGDRRVIDTIREDPKFRLRVKNAWFAMQKVKGWDGYKRFITAGGLFDTGLLPEITQYFKENKIGIEISDKRTLFKEKGQIHALGKYKARDYQAEAVKVLLENKLYGLKFQRGILYEATNAGKNLIAAFLISSFATKRKGLFLINNKVIFNQAIEELTELLGKDTVGWCSSEKGVNWKRFNVCMVQTLSNRIKSDRQIKRDVEECSVLVVDEADEVIGYKVTKHILSVAWNAPIRVALTGSADTAKDKIKNKEVIAFFGPILHKTTNKELVEAGYSAKPIIKIHTGNEHIAQPTYVEEYEEAIIKNLDRNKKIWKRVKYHLKRGRTSILILYRYHKHLKYLWKTMPKSIQRKYRVVGVHGKNTNREQILKEFREEKVEILICSMIIKRGKNLPRMKALINAAGGDSHTTVKQILGRGMRKEAGVKEEIHMDDFFDMGNYLKRHSKHRVIYYRNEGFPIKELYKK